MQQLARFGQRFGTRRCDAGDRPDPVDIGARYRLDQRGRIFPVQDEAVRIGQREPGFFPREHRERAPGAADQIEIPSRSDLRTFLADHLLQLVAQFRTVAAAKTGQTQGPRRQAAPLACFSVGHRHEFEAAAPQIRDDPSRRGKCSQHTLGADPRFVGAAEQSRFKPERCDARQELLAILRVADRCGSDRIDFFHIEIGQ